MTNPTARPTTTAPAYRLLAVLEGSNSYSASGSIVALYKEAVRLTLRLGARRWHITRPDGTPAVSWMACTGVVFMARAKAARLHLPG